jgi:hypothetical protein
MTQQLCSVVNKESKMSKFFKIVAVLFVVNCAVNIAYATYVGWDTVLCEVNAELCKGGITLPKQ